MDASLSLVADVEPEAGIGALLQAFPALPGAVLQGCRERERGLFTAFYNDPVGGGGEDLVLVGREVE